LHVYAGVLYLKDYMPIQNIISNLPINMHEVDKSEYVKTHEQIIEIENSSVNKHMLEPLRNYAFNIIRPYVENPAYTGINPV
jgi:hypothetical protein